MAKSWPVTQLRLSIPGRDWSSGVGAAGVVAPTRDKAFLMLC